jgi:hypothetical protein
MPQFTGFPLFTPMQEHIDTSGQIISDADKHRLTQGWLQQMTQLSTIATGSWEYRTTALEGTVAPLTQQVNQTPYGTVFYAKLAANAATNALKLGGTYVGTLLLSDGVNIYPVNVDGDTATIPILGAEVVLTGTLLTKV